MKANEAPKRLYLLPNGLISYCKNTDEDVEYTRTDAFIEKAAIWFNTNFIVHDEYGVISESFDTKEEMFENFVKFMKGE